MAVIFFHGNPLHTVGALPVLHALAPDFSLTNQRLEQQSLSAFAGKKKLLVILTSVDTPICAAVARKFSQKTAFLAEHNTVAVIISADLPFAQCRYAAVEGITELVMLSSFRSRFAEDYGVAINEGILQGLCARALILIDERDRVCYTELVNELCEEPDYESLFGFFMYSATQV